MKKTKKYIKISENKLFATILVGVVILFAILIGAFLVEINYLEENQAETGVFVNLGQYAFTVKDGHAHKQDDERILGLAEYLQNDGEKNVSLGCKSVYYNVDVVSEDKTQAMVYYGCYRPAATMYVVRGEGGWKIISPTNQFGPFGIPSCDYLEQYSIKNEIAPVCNVVQDGIFSQEYRVR